MENKNRFSITWISCIVILLTLCFFGVSDSMKGTSSAEQVCNCSKGRLSSDGKSCIDEKETCGQKVVSQPCNGSSKPSGADECSYDSTIEYWYCTCSVTDYVCETETVIVGTPICNNENDGSVGGCYSTAPSGYNCSWDNSLECYNNCVKTNETDDDNSNDKKYTCDDGKTLQTSSICEEKSGSFFPGGSSSATCANLYGEGWEGSCKMNT